MMERLSPKLVTSLLLTILVLSWGASWPIYKLAVPYTPPFLFSGMRAFFGGIILFLIAWKNRHLLKLKSNWWKYTISAILNIVLYLGLQTIGLNYLPGGLFSVLVYFQPVLLGILSWWFLGEDMTTAKILGLILGFVGIIFVSVDGLTLHVSVIGVFLALGSALSWACGVVYVKKNSEQVDAYWMVVMQLLIGGAILLLASFITENPNDVEWNGRLVLGVSWGSTLGLSISTVIYYKLINAGEASKVGAFTFLVPIIAVILSALFMGEKITINLFIGMVLVGISIYLANYRLRKLR